MPNHRGAHQARPAKSEFHGLRSPSTKTAGADARLPTACPRVVAYTGFSIVDEKGRTLMSEHVYKYIELTGSSTKSCDDAIRCAIERASKTLRNLHWFEVTET